MSPAQRGGRKQGSRYKHLYLIGFNSLRGRYAVVAGLVTAVVLVSAFLGYRQLEKVRQATTQNIEARSQLLERSRMVRNAVWMTRESLAAFLLDPDIIEQRGVIQRYLTDARLQTEMLFNNPWIKQHHYHDNIQALQNNLDKLEESVGELIQTRVDIPRSNAF